LAANGGGCSSCGHGNCDGSVACGQITPNPYSCCFYGVTLSNYGLITPLRGTAAPGKLPTPLPAAEKIIAPVPK
jgi:hypothetical protein